VENVNKDNKGEVIMTDIELIEGRNLIERGDFTDGWRDVWTIEGTHAEREDDATGKRYLQLINGAKASYRFDLPVRPDNDAVYWFSFRYEVAGSKPSNVKMTTDGGIVIFDEPFLSRKALENAASPGNAPLAEFRPYEPFALQGPERLDKAIDLVVTAASGGSRDGINITDFKIDLRLAPLELSELSLDDRSIPLAIPSRPAVS
jgi:hypothetical protein